MKQLFSLLSLISALAHAELPQIITHSDPSVTVTRGDSLVLSMDATGDNLQYQWIRNHSTLCQQSECTLDTSEWQLGRHRIVTMVYNAEGSAKVDLIVQIMPEPHDYQPKTIRPEKVEAQAPKKINLKTDLTVRSTKGVGYLKKSKDVQVIGRTSRSLVGTEEIKAQDQAIVVIQKDKSFEHILLSSTDVTLQMEEEGLATLQLQQGVLRSRQLAPSLPEWTIKMDRSMTLRGDEKSDFVLIKDHETKSHIQLIVLRGEVTLTLSNGTEQTLTAGTMAVANHTTIGQKLWKPYFKIMQYIFIDSSPQYILRQQQSDGSRNTSFISTHIAQIAKGDYDTNFKAALDSLSQADYLLALEYLLPVYSQNKGNAELNTTLGIIYKNLGVYPQAVRFFQEAIKIQPQDFSSHYQILELYTESRNWEKAIEWSKKAYAISQRSPSNLAYYSGVAYFNNDEQFKAKSYFQEAIFDSTHEEIRSSAQEFLYKIEDQKSFRFLGYLNFGQDSNVYRFPSQGSRSSYYEGEASLFMQAGFQAAYNAFKSKQNHLIFGFDLDKIYYMDSKFKDVEKLDQKIYLDWALHLNPYAAIGLSPFIHIMTFGKNRALDTFGIELRYGISKLDTQIKLISESTSDPVPGQFDKLEPHTHEPVAPTDRSGSVLRLQVHQGILYSRTSKLDAMVHYDSYSYSETKNADFTDLILGAKYKYTGLSSSTIPLSLLITQRSYESDSGMIFDLGSGYIYQLNPRWSTGLMLDYRVSGVKNRDYNQSLIYTTLQIDL